MAISFPVFVCDKRVSKVETRNDDIEGDLKNCTIEQIGQCLRCRVDIFCNCYYKKLDFIITGRFNIKFKEAPHLMLRCCIFMRQIPRSDVIYFFLHSISPTMDVNGEIKRNWLRGLNNKKRWFASCLVTVQAIFSLQLWYYTYLVGSLGIQWLSKALISNIFSLKLMPSSDTSMQDKRLSVPANLIW